jgi:hypothetical protein
MHNPKHLIEKWTPVLDAESAPALNSYKKAVVAQLLENTEAHLREQRAHSGFLTEAPTNSTSGGNAPIDNWDPVLISLVRRAMPNLIAYDIAGVQPMTGPTGMIFAMKARYRDNPDRMQSSEALFQEADSAFASSSVDNTADPFEVNPKAGAQGGDSASLAASFDSAGDSVDPLFGFGEGMTTNEGEALGNGRDNDFNEMSFTIERATVTAKTRALKAEYTMELAQDLKAIHGLDAEAELANILSAEILAEINREFVRTINSRARLGCQQPDLASPGIFDLDVDADGRWSVEKYKGLLVQLHREANQIAKDTRRGKGNFILCSSDVAAVLSATGLLDYAPALAANAAINPDDTGNTMIGTLQNGMKVYIDPYTNVDYLTVGYRGTNPYDAGMFYCPYVPLTMVRAVGENSFQPKIGFKTRYGMIANPFVGTAGGVNSTPPNGIGNVRENEYFRIFRVDGILGSAVNGG